MKKLFTAIAFTTLCIVNITSVQFKLSAQDPVPRPPINIKWWNNLTLTWQEVFHAHIGFEGLPKEEHLEKIKTSEYGTLITRIIELSSKLGFRWSGKRHYLVKQDLCPHCHKRIQHRFQRIGELSGGKYNIEYYNIEDGIKEHTSIMSDDPVWWIGRWSNQELKNKMRISLEGEN